MQLTVNFRSLGAIEDEEDDVEDFVTVKPRISHSRLRRALPETLEPPPVQDFSMEDALIAKSSEKLQEMAASMNDRLNNLDAEFEARSLAVFAQAQEDLAYTAKPFEPIETNMDPGSRVGITGDFLQPNPWTLSQGTAKVSESQSKYQSQNFQNSRNF